MAACLLALLLGAQTAAAQTPVTLVSNIGQTSGASSSLGLFDNAQGFTTGANATGYTLTSVEVKFSSAPSGVSVKIATGLPSSTTEVATLTNPSSLGSGNNTFTAPEGTRLAANTTYWVVVEGSSGDIVTTDSDAEDSGGSTGWSVANSGNYRDDTSTGMWTGGQNTTNRQIRITGHAYNPPVPVDFTNTFVNSPPGTLVSIPLVVTGTTTSAFTDSDDTSETVTVIAGPSVPAGSRSDVVHGTRAQSRRLFFQAKSNAELNALRPKLANPVDTWVELTIRDKDGNEATANVRFRTGWPDETPPAFQSAAVNGTTLSVTFDEALDTGSAPLGSAFKVSVTRDGSTKDIFGTSAAVSISGAMVTVTLAEAVLSTDTGGLLFYTAPGSSPLRDTASTPNAVESFFPGQAGGQPFTLPGEHGQPDRRSGRGSGHAHLGLYSRHQLTDKLAIPAEDWQRCL